MRSPFSKVPNEVLGVALLLTVFGGSVLVFSGKIADILHHDGRAVEARFANAARLTKGSPVRVRGVKVGSVKSQELAPAGTAADVKMEIDPDIKLYRDARAVLRWRTALGGAYAVAIDPGSPAAGPLGSDSIGLGNTENQVEVDEILGSIRAPQRRGLKTMLAEMPKAFSDRLALARTLDKLADVSPAVQGAIEPVRGERDGDLQRLVANTAAVVQAADQPDAAVQHLVEGAAATLQTTAAREADIQAAIYRASGVVPRATNTMVRLNRTLRNANGLIDDLQISAPAVEPTLSGLHPVAARARSLLDRSAPLLRTLRPALASLASAARTARPVLDGLTPSIERLQKTVLPGMAEKDKDSGLPSYQMIGPTFAGLNSAASQFDAEGHLIRLAVSGGEQAPNTAPCKTYITDPTAPRVFSCEALLKLMGTLFAPPPTSKGRVDQ